jgi:DNA-directed RNA polymerase specialized sigma24 family protein
MSDIPTDRTAASHNQIEDLFHKARAGDAEAAQELVERWVPYLLREIRQRLNLTPRLRSLYDSEDFLQEVRLQVYLKTEGFARFDSLRNGLSYPAIAQELGVHASTLRRIVQTVVQEARLAIANTS